MAQEPRKTQPRPAKPRVIVTRRLPPDVEARMAELFDASFNVGDVAMSRADLASAMAQCDVLVPTIGDQIDAALIAGAADRLQLIASFGSGVDHIDLIAARKKGVIVTNTPGVLTEDTADMTMALILSVPRRLAEGEKLVRAGQWRGWSPSGMLGHRIGGKKLGIIGMGRIARSRAAPALSACRSPIITAIACRSRWSRNWRRNGRAISTLCSPAATFCRSTVL